MSFQLSNSHKCSVQCTPRVYDSVCHSFGTHRARQFCRNRVSACRFVVRLSSVQRVLHSQSNSSSDNTNYCSPIVWGFRKKEENIPGQRGAGVEIWNFDRTFLRLLFSGKRLGRREMCDEPPQSKWLLYYLRAAATVAPSYHFSGLFFWHPSRFFDSFPCFLFNTCRLCVCVCHSLSDWSLSSTRKTPADIGRLFSWHTTSMPFKLQLPYLPISCGATGHSRRWWWWWWWVFFHNQMLMLLARRCSSLL